MKLTTVKQMRGMDRHAVESLGITEELLMENAALASVGLLQRELGIPGRKFVIFCGTGNNGGDGKGVSNCLKLQGKKRGF